MISNVTGKNIKEVLNYFREIETDEELLNHLKKKINESPESRKTDKNFKYGRRIGWYAFVRILKPKIVIETGIDKGLGSCVLASALIKNKEEGFEGYYYGTDINPKAGYLFDGVYKKFGEILYGDSIESLKKFDIKIDLFINDSDHSAEYEYNEYLTIQNNISDDAVILGDNSHCSDKLYKFSIENGRRFYSLKKNRQIIGIPARGLGFRLRRRVSVLILGVIFHEVTRRRHEVPRRFLIPHFI